MKIRNLIAVLLVFSLAFTFASCKTVNKNSSEAYVVKLKDTDGDSKEIEIQVDDSGTVELVAEDKDGNKVDYKAVYEAKDGTKYDVEVEKTEDGEIKYYYTNDNDEKVEIKEDDVTVERMYTDEEQSYINEIENNPDQIYDEQNAELEIGDDVIETDDMTEVSVAVDSDTGNPDRKAAAQDILDTIQNQDKYTIVMVMKNISGSEVSSMTMTMMRDGDNLYVSTEIPVDESKSIPAVLIVKDGKCKIYMTSMKAYMEIPEEYVDEKKQTFDVSSSTDTYDDAEYQSSYKATINGVTYDVDVYTQDGMTVKYFYANDQIKRVETSDDSGDKTIIEYQQITNTVDSSKFNEPKGYFNFTDLIDSGDFASLF